MATIAKTSVAVNGDTAMAETTLGASDTFAFVRGKTKYLILRNPTAGALTVNIDGAGATSQPVAGVGSIDLTAGFSTAAIGAGAVKVIPLDSISSYLAGVIAVTGGVGIIASILEV